MDFPAPSARSSKGELLRAFFQPPPSSLGMRLRSAPPRNPKGPARDAAAEADEALRRLSLHAASVLPVTALRRILDGSVPGSADSLEGATRRQAAADSIANNGGKDGSGLRSKLSTLADFADFASAGGFDGAETSCYDIFASSVGSAQVQQFLLWERARGFHEGAVHAAPSALADLKFAAAHLGLDAPDLKSGLVSGSARLSIDYSAGEEVPKPSHAGTVPLRLQAGREALCNARQGIGPEGVSTVVWAWTASRIIAFLFGLRKKELRSARLVRSAEGGRSLVCTLQRIVISFLPKGNPDKSRVIAHRYAFGVLGPFVWWDRYLSLFGLSPTLAFGFDTGKLLTARRLTGQLSPKGCTAGKAVFSIPEYGLPPATVSALCLQEHSDHGSINDLIQLYGKPLGFDPVADGLVAGHWMGQGASEGAGGAGVTVNPLLSKLRSEQSRHAATLAAQVARYQNDAPAFSGPSTIWRALGIAYYAIKCQGLDWREIEPESGWRIAREFAVQNPKWVIGELGSSSRALRLLPATSAASSVCSKPSMARAKPEDSVRRCGPVHSTCACHLRQSRRTLSIASSRPVASSMRRPRNS